MLSQWVDYHLGIFQLPKNQCFIKEMYYFFYHPASLLFLISFSILAVCAYFHHPSLLGLGIFFLTPFFFSLHVQSIPKSCRMSPWNVFESQFLLRVASYLGLNNRLLLDYCHSFLITFPGIIGNDDNNDNFNINAYYLLISVCLARHCNNVLYEDYLI